MSKLQWLAPLYIGSIWYLLVHKGLWIRAAKDMYQFGLKKPSKPLNWDTAIIAKRKLRTHCNAAMLSPSWWGGSAAATSALRNTRFDKYHIGLELGCPQPPEGLEWWTICIQWSKQRATFRHDRRKSTVTHQPLYTDLLRLPAFIHSANCGCLHCDTFGCTLNETCSVVLTWPPPTPPPQAARPRHTSYSWPAQSGSPLYLCHTGSPCIPRALWTWREKRQNFNFGRKQIIYVYTKSHAVSM